jgi:hypothetical protein
MSMTCHPGQDETMACAGASVLLRPTEGTFESQETVWLISSHGGDDDMTVVARSPNGIVAQVPLQNPGDGEDGETFTVRMGDYEVSGVIIVGPAGNYPDPPMHTASAQPGQGGVPAAADSELTLQPLDGDFANGGQVLLTSILNQQSAQMGVQTWSADQIRAQVPSTNPGTGEQGETFAIEITTDAGTTFTVPAVAVEGPDGGYPAGSAEAPSQAVKLPAEEYQK